MRPPFFDFQAYLPRVKAMRGPFLPLAERLVKSRRVRLGVALFRLDQWLFALGVVR